MRQQKNDGLGKKKHLGEMGGGGDFSLRSK
jgi:hypothetical protein